MTSRSSLPSSLHKPGPPGTMQPSHYRTVAQWLKEVGLLIFAALVVQNFVKGAEIFDPVVLTGVIVSIALYAFALYCLLKS